MKKLRCVILFLSVMVCAVCMAQTVSNVRFAQLGEQVKITYSLDQTADVSVYFSEDGGLTWSKLSHLTGNVGKNVPAGENAVYWDALAEYEQIVGSNICFRVMAQGAVQTVTVSGVSFRMILVEGGTFMMGATVEQGSDAVAQERPVHQVTLTDYYIAETEVTQALWQAVMNATPSKNTGKNLPVEMVSWNDCQTFLTRLNQLTGLQFALPTEAQWEYAARGGNKSKSTKYSGGNNLKQTGWFGDNAGNKTRAVGTKQPNELGLYDMSGNVWEWCQDWYGTYSSAAQTDPEGVVYGTERVARGGSVYRPQWMCRTSSRNKFAPIIRNNDLGLRLVLLP